MSKRNISQEVVEQKNWIDYCGGSLSGYITKYGSINDSIHCGDGAEAIYKADKNSLFELMSLVKYTRK